MPSEETTATPLLSGTRVLLEEHGRLLLRIGAGAELVEVAEAFCSSLVKLFPGASVSLLMADRLEGRLRTLAAPNLRSSYSQLVDGLKATAGDPRGPVYFGDTIRTSDEIALDETWADFRSIAAENGLAACWAVPVRSAQGSSSSADLGATQVRGTLFLYFDSPQHATAEDLDLLAAAGNAAGLALLAHGIHYRAGALEVATTEEGPVIADAVDPLTGLPGRSLFFEQLGKHLSNLDPKHHRLAVLLIDIDQLRQINETFGYAVGDFLLKSVAGRLRELTPEGDYLCRFGNDEFVLLITDVQRNDEVKVIAQKILDSLGEHYDFGGHELFTTVSLGASLYPWDGEDARTLVRNSESALYSVKTRGTNAYQLYAPTMGINVFERLQRKMALSQALERQEFELYYQPKVASDTLEISGAEALIRWRSPTLGFVSPADFIPLAEETGLIFDIGEWVLREGLEQVKKWRRAGYKNICLAINMSPVQFRARRFMDTVTTVVDRAGLEPQAVEIEVTESVAMTEVRQSLERLEQIRALGLKIAIDDFGTGYSSLSYLKRFHIDTLKIDQVFVRDIDATSENQAIVRAVIAMSHHLGFEIVAEGVETEKELNFLLENGCQVLQGYYFSRPVPVTDFTRLMEAGLDPGTGRSYISPRPS